MTVTTEALTRPADFLPRGSLAGCPTLDIHHLIAGRHFTPGNDLLWAWGEPPETVVRLWISRSCLTLFVPDPAGRVGQQCVPIEYVPAQFGGMRPLLVCPACNQGFYRLYLRVGVFACQKCQRLKYTYGDTPETRTILKQRALGYVPTADVAELFSSLGANDAVVPTPSPCKDVALSKELLRVRDAHPNTARMINPAKQGNAGRPRTPLSEVPCTCGRGSDSDNHLAQCKRSQAVRRRRRKGQPLDD